MEDTREVYNFFFKTGCSRCRFVKSLLDKKRVRYNIIDTNTQEGLMLAKKYNVQLGGTVMNSNWQIVNPKDIS